MRQQAEQTLVDPTTEGRYLEKEVEMSPDRTLEIDLVRETAPETAPLIDDEAEVETDVTEDPARKRRSTLKTRENLSAAENVEESGGDVARMIRVEVMRE